MRRYRTRPRPKARRRPEDAVVAALVLTLRQATETAIRVAARERDALRVLHAKVLRRRGWWTA